MLPRLHIVTDDRVLARPDVTLQAARLLESGGPAIAFHLRGPQTPARALYDIGGALRAHARKAGAPFFVNDRLDLARVLDADGVQLGRQSVSPEQVLRLLGGASVGRSVHSLEEALAAEREGATFVLLGAVYATRSHPGVPALGPDVLRRVAERLAIPVLAIGGLTPARLTEVLACGAQGGAVLSAAWDAVDPVSALHACMEASAGVRVYHEHGQ